MPLLHVVALRFKAHLSEADIITHMETEVALKRRMPELVDFWLYKRNESLLTRPDVNGGCQWVVISQLYDAESLPTYLNHPAHKELAAIQAPLLEGKIVLDFCVSPGDLGGMA